MSKRRLCAGRFTQNPIPSLAYDLAIADVNYGCNKAGSVEDNRWGRDSFDAFFFNLHDANKAKLFTVVVFLHERQIHDAREVLLCTCYLRGHGYFLLSSCSRCGKYNKCAFCVPAGV